MVTSPNIYSFDRGNLELDVGQEGETDLIKMWIDKDLFCSRSEYGRMMVRNREKDKDDSPIRVHGDPETFAEYLRYLVRDYPVEPKAFIPYDLGDSSAAAIRQASRSDRRAVRAEYANMGELYVLVSYLQDFKFMSNVMGRVAHAIRDDSLS